MRIQACGNTSKPVLTGYEIRAGESDGEIPASSDLRTLPPSLKDDVVAALKEKIALLKAGIQTQITPGSQAENAPGRKAVESAVCRSKRT
ncbi:MAG: hypothetical protein IJ783_09920 [Kiritimatiellae bacterium]|nr:hypothetical protein [Kiritimatiellia bacterium]